MLIINFLERSDQMLNFLSNDACGKSRRVERYALGIRDRFPSAGLYEGLECLVCSHRDQVWMTRMRRYNRTRQNFGILLFRVIDASGVVEPFSPDR